LVQGLVELGDLTREQFDVEELRELLDDDAAESSDWTAITLASARLGISDYWTRVWQPWQQSEAARSNSALGRILDVSAQRVAACEGIARAYAPDAQTLKQWGGLLQFMEPLGPCGRCPHCRATGIAPNTDPPPAPAQVWAVDSRDYTGLGAFARASRAVNGVAILTYSPGEAEIAGTIADRLVALGVRHLAGVSLANPALTGSPLFIDERPAAPIDLTPFPSFSYFGQGQRVSGSWLSRRAAPRVDASGSPLVDTLLVPVGARISGRSVGRDLPSVSAITASELLGVK
jgi:hypothetical protein